MAYDGQIHEVRTPLPSARLSREEISSAFETSYHAQYGDTLGHRPIKVTTLRTTVIGVRPKTPLLPSMARATGRLAEAQQGVRPVYMDNALVDCPIYWRERLPLGASFAGPAIIEQTDTTTVVEPGMLVQVDAHGNLILQEG
jgi:N-methylhydantoinase A